MRWGKGKGRDDGAGITVSSLSVNKVEVVEGCALSGETNEKEHNEQERNVC